jgi:hypothetical protein
MQYLIDLAGRADIGRIVTAATESPLVQGVVLEPDSYWLSSWNAFSLSDKRTHQNLAELWRHFLRLGGLPFWMAYEPLGQPARYNIPLRPIDLSDVEKWRPDDWSLYQDVLGLKETALPIVLKICLLPSAEGERPDLPRFENPPFQIAYEVRPRAFLHSNPRKQWRPLVGGVSVGAGTAQYGTLGGILEAPNKQRYGMTCAHVFTTGLSVDQPAQYDSAKKAANIGVRAQGTNLAPTPSGTLCNPITATNEVDAALVDLGKGVSSDLEVLDIGKLSGSAKIASMSVGQTVETTGRTSGHRLLEVGGMAVTYQFEAFPGGPKYCFKNLFEIRWPYFSSLKKRPPVQPGDSGSWVCMPNSTGCVWCGMVVGGDRVNGYATFAENVEKWWTAPPLSLQLRFA